MNAKRKVTFEQSEALDRGRKVARANQRRAVAAKQADASAAAERDRAAREQAEVCASGNHSWTEWAYADDYKTESRECRNCGTRQERAIRF